MKAVKAWGRLAVLAGLGALLPLASPMTAAAQEWPSHPIRVLVGAGAGGGTDIVARIVAEPMSQMLGQPVVVENLPGAGGTIAAAALANAAPDGHTLMMVNNGNTTAPAMFSDLPFAFPGDFAPVSLVGLVPLVLVTAPDSPFQSLSDVAEAARARPGELLYGSPAIGATQHFVAANLASDLGIELRHIPYENSPSAISAVQAAEISVLVEAVPAVLGHVRSGDLKALAVMSGERYAGLPDVPTAAESGAEGFDISSYYGIVAPAGTPVEIVAKLNETIRDAVELGATVEKFSNIATIPATSSPDEFTDRLNGDVARWAEVREAAGIPRQ